MSRVLLLLFICPLLLAGSLAVAEDTDAAALERSAWRFTQKDLTVTILQKEGPDWLAERSDGKRPTYRETERTADYIELQNVDTKLFVRLHADHAEWRRPRDKDWTQWVKGSWISAPETTNAAPPAKHEVRLAYFVPSDRKPIPKYTEKIRLVMGIVSELYETDLRSKGHKSAGIPFESGDDGSLVQLVRGDKPAAHYNNSPTYDADEQWRRLAPEIRKKVGDTRRQLIVVFTETYDAGPSDHLWPGVIARGAYYTADGGLAIYSSHLLRDELCATTVAEQRKKFFDQTPVTGRKAWGHRINSPRCEFVEDGIGAVAHELGHAFGLPHDRRQDDRDIMGNGFRNLRWNFDERSTRKAGFSEENALLLTSSRYLNAELKTADSTPPVVELKKLIGKGDWINVSVKASDDTGLRAIVFFDRTSGSVLSGQKLTGKSQTFEQRITAKDAKSVPIELQVVVTDEGGHQTRVRLEPGGD